LYNLCLQDYWDNLVHPDRSGGFNPRLPPTFSVNRRSFSGSDPCDRTEASSSAPGGCPPSPPEADLMGDRSTGSKQTLNGLFLFRTRIFMISKDSNEINPGELRAALFLLIFRSWQMRIISVKKNYLFFPYNPSAIVRIVVLLRFYLNFHTAGKIQFTQRIHSTGR
jgi:hypothetical protein